MIGCDSAPRTAKPAGAPRTGSPPAPTSSQLSTRGLASSTVKARPCASAHSRNFRSTTEVAPPPAILNPSRPEPCIVGRLSSAPTRIAGRVIQSCSWYTPGKMRITRLGTNPRPPLLSKETTVGSAKAEAIVGNRGEGTVRTSVLPATARPAGSARGGARAGPKLPGALCIVARAQATKAEVLARYLRIAIQPRQGATNFAVAQRRRIRMRG
mmetsp:Transcript_26662/g.88502  ORF Transcript_26662/g.88502 Transcript_26662/m.88502 type:complete len:212 (-) Transcript_26662:36-671(-)